MSDTKKYPQLRQAEILEQSGRVEQALALLMQANEQAEAAHLLARQQRWREAGQMMYACLGGQPAALQQLSQTQRQQAYQAANWMEQGGALAWAVEIYLALGEQSYASSLFQTQMERCIGSASYNSRAVCLELALMASSLSALSFELDHLLAQFIQTGPQNAQEAECFYRLGHTYLQHQIPENAQELFQCITTFDPNYRDVQEVLNRLKVYLRGSVASFEKILQQEESFRGPASQGRLAVAAQFVELPELPELPPLPNRAAPLAPQPAHTAQHPRSSSAALPFSALTASTSHAPSSITRKHTAARPVATEEHHRTTVIAQSAVSHDVLSLDSQEQLEATYSTSQAFGLQIQTHSSPLQANNFTQQFPHSGVVDAATLLDLRTPPPGVEQTVPEIRTHFSSRRLDTAQTSLTVGTYLPGRYGQRGGHEVGGGNGSAQSFSASPQMNSLQSSLAALSKDSVFVPGAVIDNRYRIERELGQGGMAVVYSAFDLKLEEVVGLKVFEQGLIGEDKLYRFKQELKLARKLSHPNIIRLHDMGEYQRHHYISMELLEGLDLEQVLLRQGALEIQLGLTLLIQVCMGLQSAHSLGVIHRDMKPSNIFITTGGIAKIMDFGIAVEQASERFTQEGVIVGTAAYISPERIIDPNHIAATGDLYSLGIIAYETFTGTSPFDHNNELTLLRMHLKETPPPPRSINPQLPQALEDIILRLLEKNPKDRFQSCHELLQHLHTVQALV